METLSLRQREILFLLKGHRDGLSIPKLEESLGISRTAVTQHLTNLELDGLIAKGTVTKTKGRPGSVYLITAKGIDQLPKQYSWFSELMLDALKEKLGAEGLSSFLRELAVGIGKQLQPKLVGQTFEEKIEEVNHVLNELGYDAHVVPSTSKELPMLSAHNCVYHKLADKHPEVCQFDLALLEALLENQEAIQEECMVRGGTACRFRFHSSATPNPS